MKHINQPIKNYSAWKSFCDAAGGFAEEMALNFSPKTIFSIPENDNLNDKNIFYSPDNRNLDENLDKKLSDILLDYEFKHGKCNYLLFIAWWDVEDFKFGLDKGKYKKVNGGVLYIPNKHNINETLFGIDIISTLNFSCVIQLKEVHEPLNYENLKIDAGFWKNIITVSWIVFDFEGWLVAHI